jgi:hypothetical protein
MVTASDVPRHVPSTTSAHDHEPFTEHDLSLALTRSHLAVSSH